MCRKTLFTLSGIAALLCSGGLQATELPERLGQWQATERKTYIGQSLYDHIDGGAEVYFEYGFARVEVGYYDRDEKEIQVEVYRMANPFAAAGIYSFLRNPNADSLPVPYEGKLYESYLECLNGNELIKMIAFDSLGAGQRIVMFHDPNQIWVEANVKETSIGLLKPGMKVDVRVDAYPGRVVHGEIYRIGQAATSKFALLPDPNPSGNFTKITQRLPVRIRLTDKDVELRPGMMVEVDIPLRND